MDKTKNSVFSNIVLRTAGLAWKALNFCVPKDDNLVVICTFPDFDDTFYALEKPIRETGKKLVVLLRGVNTKPKCRNAPICARVNSLRGVLLYHRSRVIFYTHGLYSRFQPGKRQIVINLWHGSPIKKVGGLEGVSEEDLPKFDYVLAENRLYRSIISEVFKVPKNKVLIHPHPRVDRFHLNKNEGILDSPFDSPYIIWLPTYRSTEISSIRDDGDINKILFFDKKSELSKLNSVLVRYNLTCFLKPHPMETQIGDLFSEFSNLHIIHDRDLLSMGRTLYEIIGGSEFLISDISSVIFEFQSVGKHVVIFFPDIEEYAENRGFVRPLETLIQGKINRDIDSLASNIDIFCSKNNQATEEGSLNESPFNSAQSLLSKVDLLLKKKINKRV